MLNCPKCGSTKVYRSHTRSAWERWRREITAKCPLRCHRCGWRGWKPDPGPHFSREEIEAANRALVKPLDAGSLDAGAAQVRTGVREERTRPGGGPADPGSRPQDLDMSTLDQVFTTSAPRDHRTSRH